MPTDAELGIDPQQPRVHGRFARTLGRLVLAATGFRAAGRRPVERKYVLIAAPHTSNWDLVYMIALSYVFDIEISWLGKHTLFESALGPLLKRLGGLPVDRRSPQNLVQQAAARFAAADDLIIAVPPEGTRKHVEHWKTGFYYIALEAGVPIVPTVLDYKTRTGTMLAPFQPTGDLEADIAHLQALYQDAEGKHAHNKGQVRVRPRVDEKAA